VNQLSTATKNAELPETKFANKNQFIEFTSQFSHDILPGSDLWKVLVDTFLTVVTLRANWITPVR
jgi:hypothetical protein